ncbi:MAG TPA: type II secretion system protein GspG [Gammaproteobacteria bacterium]|nr:type II secretion system protein GspG [Gammaproteobacteria bacterium]
MPRLETRTHQARGLEWALVLIFISVMILVVTNYFDTLEKRARTMVARYELQNLRSRLATYRARHGHWPATLREALGERAIGDLREARKPLGVSLFDSQGRMLDPFGQPYHYSPDTGRLETPEVLKTAN